MTIDKRNRVLSIIVIVLTFIMVFLPVQIAFGWLQRAIVEVTGAVSVVAQIILLLSADTKSKKTQSYILLALSLIAITLMLIRY
jgi:hypothetical protein